MIRSIRPGGALRALVLGSAFVAGACREDSQPTGPSLPPEPAGLRQATPDVQGTLIDPMLAHARAIPGFGGLFLEPGSGAPTVYLTDPGKRGTAEQVLAGTLRELGAAPSQLRVLRGDYDYLQLDRWLSRAAPEALAIPGAVFTDLDEGSNRLRIGVETAVAEQRVRGVLSRLAIPDAAVVTEQADPIQFLATLQDRLDPKRGGIQIAWGTKFCTLGFNTWAQSGFLIVRSFITNSHCSFVQGGIDGTQYYQPVALSSTLIGSEVADPAYFTTFPCPAGRRCRYSDAARVRYQNGVSFDLGGIARTTFREQLWGSITIDPSNPFFNITSEVASPVQFSVLNKIGLTTGWTTGVVTATCVGVNVQNTNITLLCQDRVAAGAHPGDSGSPVFAWSGSGNNVALHGILWGSNKQGTLFAFSRMSGIEFELGALRTF